MPFAATLMDLETIILSEVSKIQASYDITYMWNLKMDTHELICRLRDFEKIMVTGNRMGGGRDGLGVWDLYRHSEVYGIIGQWGPAV